MTRRERRHPIDRRSELVHPHRLVGGRRASELMLWLAVVAVAIITAGLCSAERAGATHIDTGHEWQGTVTVYAKSEQLNWTHEEWATYTINGPEVHWTAETKSYTPGGDDCSYYVEGSGSGSEGWLTLEFGEPSGAGEENLLRYTFHVDSDVKYPLSKHYPCSIGVVDDQTDAQGAPDYEDAGQPALFFDAPLGPDRNASAQGPLRRRSCQRVG